MIEDWRRALLTEQFAAPVREYRPALDPVTEAQALVHRRILNDALDDDVRDSVPLLEAQHSEEHDVIQCKADLVVGDDGALAEVIPIRRRCPVCHEPVGIGPVTAPYVVPHGSTEQPGWCSGSLDWPVAR